MTQWDFLNKGKSGWTGRSSFVLEVPLRHLRPSVIYSVPCDRILQRAYLLGALKEILVELSVLRWFEIYGAPFPPKLDLCIRYSTCCILCYLMQCDIQLC